MCNWTLKIWRYIENIVEKRRNCSLGAIFPLFQNIFLAVVKFSCLGRDQIFIRDKRLFEISEVEITRANCICWNILFSQSLFIHMELDLETGCLTIPKVKRFGKKSFAYNGCVLWNTLPKEIKSKQRHQTG